MNNLYDYESEEEKLKKQIQQLVCEHIPIMVSLGSNWVCSKCGKYL